ncbi:MAG TPA: hypothetical protein VD902_01360 [Symbiobacteriaceae bacterium]|nr:hypothetical protein [Symbiobacteriaceae bacterium]
MDEAEDREFGNQEGTSLPEALKEKQARLARKEETLALLQEQQDNGERTTWTDLEKQTINPALIPTLDATQEATGKQPEQLLADTGYFSGDTLPNRSGKPIRLARTTFNSMRIKMRTVAPKGTGWDSKGSISCPTTGYSGATPTLKLASNVRYTTSAPRQGPVSFPMTNMSPAGSRCAPN